MLRKLLLGLVLLIVVLAGIVVLVARGAVGNDALRTALEQQLTASLKQPVRIARLGASFYPRVAIDLHDITIGEPAGATVAQLSVTTGLRGLLSRRVEDAEVIVSNSRIPVPIAVGIAGAVTSSRSSAPGQGITIGSVNTLAFRHVEVVAGAGSLFVDLESSLAGDRLDVTHLAAQSNGTRLEASGAMTSLARGQGRFTATASQLNLDELLAVASGLTASGRSRPSPVTPASPGSADSSPLDLTVELTAPGGTLGGYAFTALATTLHATPTSLQLQPLHFGVFGGRYDGRMIVGTGAPTPDVALEGRMAGLDMPTILREARGTSSLSGKLSGNVNLTTRGTSGDEMLAAARGSGHVTIVDGIIPGLEMVRTLVLAFGKPSGSAPGGSGSAFKQIETSFTLANRTLHSDNLSLVSRDFDMAGATTIHLPEGGVDMHGLRQAVGRAHRAGRDRPAPLRPGGRPHRRARGDQRDRRGTHA